VHAEPLSPTERRSFRVRAVWLVLVALVAHALAVFNGFVLDDRILLVENPHLRSWSGLGQVLRHELFVASAEPRFVPYYRPLSGLLNWLSFQALGTSAALQHALNLLLHAGVTALALRALRSLGVRPSLAFSGCFLFAVHPATAEVVAYIGGRQDLLGWLVLLGAMDWSPRVQSLTHAAALGFVASLVGGFCHELFLASFVPLALLVGLRDSALAKRGGVAVVVGGVAAVSGVLALRHTLGLLPFETGVDGPVRALRAAVGVFLRLMGDALLPTDLAVDVTVPLPGFALTTLVAAGGVAATVALARFVAARERALLGPLLAGVGVVVMSCALHAGVVLKYGIISDRYAYALLLGLVITLTCACQAAVAAPATAPSDDASPLVAFAKKWAALALGVALLPLTWSRDAAWVDQKSLQLAMIADRPDDPESWLAEGMLHFHADDLEQAYPKCRAYADARPDSDKANLCVGSWLLTHRRPAEAVEYLRPYALSRPGIAQARHTFLFALLASRQYDEASRTLTQWLQQFPNAPELLEARAALAAAPPSARP